MNFHLSKASADASSWSEAKRKIGKRRRTFGCWHFVLMRAQPSLWQERFAARKMAFFALRKLGHLNVRLCRQFECWFFILVICMYALMTHSFWDLITVHHDILSTGSGDASENGLRAQRLLQTCPNVGRFVQNLCSYRRVDFGEQAKSFGAQKLLLVWIHGQIVEQRGR